MTDIAEPALAQRIRSGDASAFDTLFRAHYQELCLFAYSYLRSPEAAEEIVQDVFTAIWTRRATWSVHESAEAYLFGAVRNRALRRLARGRIELRWRRRASEPVSSAPALPDRELERAEAEQVVRAAVAELPERSRMAITLRWQHQMTYPEIAAAMGISVKGVEQHLARGTKRLRKLLTHLHIID